MYASARVESKVQQADLRFVRPPTESRWVDTYAIGAQRTDIENLVTRTAAVTYRRRAIDERRTPAFGIGFYENEQTPSGFPTETSHALYLDGEYTWRNVDNLLEPWRGWMANLQLGVGPPGVSTEKFGRVIGHAVLWWPLSRSDQLVARADAGAVIAQIARRHPLHVPVPHGRRHHRARLRVREPGRRRGRRGGRRPLLRGRQRGSRSLAHRGLGVAAFVDAGNATDSLTQFHPAIGYGVGARLRTPIGPFRLDVAYGEDVHSVRVHFSVGLSF